MGGVWGSKVYFAKLSQHLNSDIHNISHYEMINIVLVLRIWDTEWFGKRVVLNTDNMAVVNICNNRFTKDKHLAAFNRSIWLLTAKLELVVCHIAGRKNGEADLLSRWTGTVEQQVQLNEWVVSPKWCSVSDNDFYID